MSNTASPRDFECVDTPQLAATSKPTVESPLNLVAYLILGIYLGAIFMMSEVVSWYRIQEMFRFQSFHLYGIIGSAVVVGVISVQLIKRFNLHAVGGQPIKIEPKDWSGIGTRYWLGGTLFGLGWALVGACPGPMFAVVGSGVTVMLVAIAAAMLGTWAYAALRHKLPH